MFTVNFADIYENIKAQKFHFLAAFFCIFTLSYGVLYALDVYPEPVTSTVASTTVPAVTAPVETAKPTTTAAVKSNDRFPNELRIPTLERVVEVLNPASNSVAALDAALLEGVIRHPDSAMFGEEGNMLILGHSSYLPTVHNRNFQALNGIQNLKFGDEIVLTSKDTEYTYKVEKTFKTKASGYTVPVAGRGNTLTLVTCNSFGSTEDRYVVEATLVSAKAL